MNMNLPNDPMLLLSVVNTKLRDVYTSLDDLCEDYNIEKDTLIDRLVTIDYEYDSQANQFI